MAQTLYCWRCDLELPMLDELEWAQLAPLLEVAIREFMEERRCTGVGPGEAQDTGILGRRALAFYRELTGFEETQPQRPLAPPPLPLRPTLHSLRQAPAHASGEAVRRLWPGSRSARDLKPGVTRGMRQCRP
jgi:hypothetical protein